MSTDRKCNWCGKSYNLRRVYDTKFGTCCRACDRALEDDQNSVSSLQKRIDEERDAFYLRECPMCAETVKAKALLCKECGHKFEDGQQYRDRIKEWEDRAEPFGLDPWDKQAIFQKEYEQTPEYKAQKAKELEEERHEQELIENKQREIRETEERYRRINEEVEAEYQDYIFKKWSIIIALVFFGMWIFISK